MTIIYLIVALIINSTDSTSQVIEGVNTIFNSNFSGEAIFWYGLFIAFVLDLITG